MAFPYTLAAFTIASGAAVSNQVFIGDGELVGIVMDASAWTTALITFLASADGTNYYPIFDGTGTLVQVGGASTLALAAATYIAIGEEAHMSFAHFRGVQYLQLQSSSVASNAPTAVNQGGARVLTGVIRKTTTGTF